MFGAQGQVSQPGSRKSSTRAVERSSVGAAEVSEVQIRKSRASELQLCRCRGESTDKFELDGREGAVSSEGVTNLTRDRITAVES